MNRFIENHKVKTPLDHQAGLTLAGSALACAMMVLAWAPLAVAQLIPDSATTPGGSYPAGYRPTTPSAIVNPNNGSACVVGNTGCPGLPGASTTTPFIPISPTVFLVATSASPSVQLTGGGTVALVYNSGLTTAYVALGSSTVTASVTNMPIPPGATVPLAIGANTYIAGYSTGLNLNGLTITSGTGSASPYTVANTAGIIATLMNGAVTPPFPVYVGGYNYTNITTSTSIQVKSTSGTLGTVCINEKGTSSNTLTLYDNTSATAPIIATIDTTSTVGCIPYQIVFTTGLYAVTATGTQANITVGWR